jgi:hypothetical protein
VAVQATLTSARPFQTGIATNADVEGPVAARRVTAATRRFTVRAAAVVGLATMGMALAPMAGAFADKPSSPATPIIRSSDRGTVMAGTSEVRQPTQLQDGHGNYVAIQGGDVSAGAPIAVKDGNVAKLPTITGEAGVICSASQNVRSAMIPCFG